VKINKTEKKNNKTLDRLKEKEDRGYQKALPIKILKKSSTKDIWGDRNEPEVINSRNSLTHNEKPKHKRAFSFNEKAVLKFPLKAKENLADNHPTAGSLNQSHKMC